MLKKYDNYDLELLDVLEIIKENKIKIIFITFIFVVMSLLLFIFKNLNTELNYNGKVLIEIGTSTIEDVDIKKIKYERKSQLDSINNLKNIILYQFEVEVVVPKWTNKLLLIKYKSSNKKLIKEKLEAVVEYIIKRHEVRSEVIFKKYIMSQQIGEIKITDEPINKPNGKVYLIFGIIVGFVFSLTYVFFSVLLNIQRNKRNIVKKYQ